MKANYKKYFDYSDGFYKYRILPNFYNSEYYKNKMDNFNMDYHNPKYNIKDVRKGFETLIDIAIMYAFEELLNNLKIADTEEKRNYLIIRLFNGEKWLKETILKYYDILREFENKN